MSPAAEYIDVTVRLAAGMPCYPGNPEFELQPIKRIADGGSSNVSKLVLGTHTGTHVDAPKHFLDDGATADQLRLEILIGPAHVIDIATRGAITEQDLASAGVDGDDRVLIKTGNSALWTTHTFHQDYAHLTEGGARYLADRGVKLVGVDYLSVEQYKKPGAPAHRALLSRNIVIIEGLNLSGVEAGVYDMYCLPLPIVGGDGAPARVVLKR
jgi:arylformamidase